MNQRMSNNGKKNNNLNFVSLNTGGQIARHSPNEDPQVQIPQKTTGDIKPEQQLGIAKASPNFKPIVPPAKSLDKNEEKKVVAENTIPVVEEKE